MSSFHWRDFQVIPCRHNALVRLAALFEMIRPAAHIWSCITVGSPLLLAPNCRLQVIQMWGNIKQSSVLHPP